MRKPGNSGADPTTGTGGRGVPRTATPRRKSRGLYSEGKPKAPSLDPAGGEATLNDAWLVEHARHGDHQAFAALVQRYERKLIRVLTRLVREPEQARDLAQETFWRIYTSLNRFDTARRFGPWLFRIGVNLGLDWIRSGKCELRSATSIDQIGSDGQRTFELPDPDPRVRLELAQEVQFVLARMPLSYRTILVLRDLEGFSCSEVAAIIGRREATVRWRLALAREKFREIWHRRQEGPRMESKDGRKNHEKDR
jgi:RNA polymerase sigma-70 factor, ECF subfamily